MDEQTQKRILMDEQTRRFIVTESFVEFAGQMGAGGGYGIGTTRGWYGANLKGEELSSFVDKTAEDMKAGARSTAKYLEVVDYSDTFVCKAPMDKAFEHTLTFIPKMRGGGLKNVQTGGKILDSAIGSSEAALAALIGSGFSNMNFTLVNMLFSAVDGNTTQIHITASSKESFISKFIQKSPQKAVRNISSMFNLA